MTKGVAAVLRVLLAGLGAALVAGLCAAFAFATAPAASATVRAPSHADVLSVTPAHGSRLERPPAQIVVAFTEEVSPAFVQVTLTGNRTAAPLGQPSVSGNTVVVPVPPGSAAAPGSYRIAYRVVSADGHPVSDSSEFTVTGPGAPTSGTAAATTGAAATPTSASSPGLAPTADSGQAAASVSEQPVASGPAPGVVVAGVVVVVLFGVGGGLLVSRRRARAR